jgi:hypothetical protein
MLRSIRLGTDFFFPIVWLFRLRGKIIFPHPSAMNYNFLFFLLDYCMSELINSFENTLFQNTLQLFVHDLDLLASKHQRFMI